MLQLPWEKVHQKSRLSYWTHPGRSACAHLTSDSDKITGLLVVTAALIVTPLMAHARGPSLEEGFLMYIPKDVRNASGAG